MIRTLSIAAPRTWRDPHEPREHAREMALVREARVGRDVGERSIGRRHGRLGFFHAPAHEPLMRRESGRGAERAREFRRLRRRRRARSARRPPSGGRTPAPPWPPPATGHDRSRRCPHSCAARAAACGPVPPRSHLSRPQPRVPKADRSRGVMVMSFPCLGWLRRGGAGWPRRGAHVGGQAAVMRPSWRSAVTPSSRPTSAVIRPFSTFSTVVPVNRITLPVPAGSGP